MPIASAAPTTMNTQGFASYSVCGVQDGMRVVYRRARPLMHFVTMTQYAFFANLSSSGAFQRLVPGAVADRDLARGRIRPHAPVHLLGGLCAPRALRRSEPRPHLPERLCGARDRVAGLLDRAPRSLRPVPHFSVPAPPVAGERQARLRASTAA